ncbi:hypothetical protein LIER_44012 [Lithospermum erythrorhizon]|uniref:Uncharacterized protein n=1 Tax=Lithospermum erythrorhizon TaxID=34254 RepID=A0AAV3RPJ1_LITER
MLASNILPPLFWTGGPGWCWLGNSPDSFLGPLSSTGPPNHGLIHVSTWEFSTSSKEDGVSPCQSSAVPVPEESYKGLLSSYEEASGSSSPPDELEGEGVMQHRLKNLVGDHTTLLEKYTTSVRRTKAVRAVLEGVQAEKDSTVKERERLRAGRDEMLQNPRSLAGQTNRKPASGADHGGHFGRHPDHRGTGGTGAEL